MKIKNFLVMTMSFLVILILSLSFFAPRIIVSKALNSFEKKIENKDIDGLKDIIYEKSDLYQILIEEDEIFFLSFSKFQSGFSVKKIKILFGYKISENKRYLTLNVSLAKRAVLDGKERIFDNISIIYDKNMWKINNYLFPDYTDY